jgi:hypothetical protein
LPGFLSLFDGTEKILLSPPGADRDYWVEVKHYLTSDEEDEITVATTGLQGVEMSGIAGMDEQQVRAHLDIAAQNRLMLLHSIVNWNLTDRGDQPLPLAPRAAKERSIASLPGGVREVILRRLMEMRKERRQTPGEKATFCGAAERGDPDGDGGSPGAPGVLDGGRVLAAPGAQEG